MSPALFVVTGLSCGHGHIDRDTQMPTAETVQMMAALAPESTTQAQAAVRRQLDECRALREGMADAIAALLKDA